MLSHTPEFFYDQPLLSHEIYENIFFSQWLFSKDWLMLGKNLSDIMLMLMWLQAKNVFFEQLICMWIVWYNVSFREKLLQTDVFFNKYKIHWELFSISMGPGEVSRS